MNIRPGEVVRWAAACAISACWRRWPRPCAGRGVSRAERDVRRAADGTDDDGAHRAPAHGAAAPPAVAGGRGRDDRDGLVADRRAADVSEERRQAAAVRRRWSLIFEQGVRWATWPGLRPRRRRNLLVSFEELWNMYWRAVDIEYSRLAADAALAARAAGCRRVRIVTEKGTDLTFRIGGRPVLVDDGVISDDDVARRRGTDAVCPRAGVRRPAGGVGRGGRCLTCVSQRAPRLRFDAGHQGRAGPAGGRPGRRAGVPANHGLRRRQDRIGEFAVGSTPAWTASPARVTDEKRRGHGAPGAGRQPALRRRQSRDDALGPFMEKPTVLVDGRPLMEAGELRLD